MQELILMIFRPFRGSHMICREEDQLGDTSTLADPSVVQTLLSMRGQ